MALPRIPTFEELLKRVKQPKVPDFEGLDLGTVAPSFRDLPPGWSLSPEGDSLLSPRGLIFKNLKLEEGKIVDFQAFRGEKPIKLPPPPPPPEPLAPPIATAGVTETRPFGEPPPRFPIEELRPATPEESSRQAAINTGQTHYWSESEKAWKLVTQPAEVPLSRVPFTQPERPVPTAELPPAQEGIGFVLDIISGRRTQENPEGLSFVEYARQFPAAEAAIVGLPATVTLGVMGYQGIRSIVPLTKDIANRTLQAVLNTGLDRWIARMSRGVPPQKFKEAQNTLYNLIARDRVWLQQRATENMVRRMGRGVNRATAVRQAVEDTVRDVEQRIVGLIPRATQTGIVRGGIGRPAQVIKALPSAQDTQILNTSQALGKTIGLDVEAIGGIAPGEYWVSISTPALKVSEAFNQWITKFPDETAQKIKGLLEGKFKVRDTTGQIEPGKRFLPFKNILDAQKFLETGDTSLIAKTITQRGVPWTPEQLAQARQALADLPAAGVITPEPISREMPQPKPFRPARGITETQAETRLTALQAKMTPEERELFQITVKPEVQVTAEVAPTSVTEPVVTPEKLVALEARHPKAQAIQQKFFRGESLTSEEELIVEAARKQLVELTALSPEDAVKLSNKGFALWETPRLAEARAGQGLLDLEEVHEAVLLKGDTFAAKNVRSKITVSDVLKDGTVIEHPEAVAMLKKLEARAKEGAVAPIPVTEPVVIPEVLDKSGNPLEGLNNEPIILNEDGTVTLFHRTTQELAEEIRRTGVFKVPPQAQDEVFFSSVREGQAEGFGEGIVEVRIKPENINLDDAFPSGEIHVFASTKDVISKGEIVTLAQPPVTEVTPPVEVPAEPTPKAPERVTKPVKKEVAPKPPTEVKLTEPPAKPPTKPPVTEYPPEPTPPSGRPRTLSDLNREAKGMRALSPDARAEAMDVVRPIDEGELLYKVKPFKEHAENLLQPDTPIKKSLRGIPGVKQVVALVNPAQMERDNPVAMIGVRKGIFEEVETGRARLATLNWWHDADSLFGFKKIKGKWKATNIQLSKSAETTKPYHATIHDLVEHPENYVFTPAQEKVLQIAQDMQRQILRDAQRVGVDAVELTSDYWRRIVTKTPKDKLFGGKVKSGITQKKGYTRQRAFDFVDEGAKAGFEYETHPLTALQNRLEAGIRTISDQNARQEIARLPGAERPLERLESRYPQTVEGIKTARTARDEAKRVYLKDTTVENEMTLRQSEADYITAQREVFTKKIEVGQPNIGELKLPNGRIAPAELVDEVRKWIDLPEIQTGQGKVTGSILAVSQMLRTTLTNVDLAAGFIQGQALFYRNNLAWWRSQGNAIVSLLDDPSAYVTKNYDIMDEGMRMGAISVPTEFLFTRQGLASLPTRIPVVGPLMKAFNRAFEWFIITGQTELYKYAKSGTIKRAGGDEKKAIEALVSLGSAIRKELGTESYTMLGVRPTQHTIEQLSLFAARFFRAITGIQAQAFTGGEGGREARRAMGSLIAGGLALLIAVSYAKDRKMPNLTDPFSPDWMQVKIGKTFFNPFGPFYPYFRTQARMSFYLAHGEPEKAAQVLKWFLQSKESLPFRALDMAAQFGMYGSYRTFEGEKIPFTPLGVAKAVLGEMAVPISIQEAMTAIPEGRLEAVYGEIFGLVGRKERPFVPEAINQLGDIDQKALDAALEEATKDKVSVAKLAEIMEKNWVYDITSLRRDISSFTRNLSESRRGQLDPIVNAYWQFNEQDNVYEKLSDKEQLKYVKDNPDYFTGRLFWGEITSIPNLKTAEALASSAEEFNIPLNMIPAFRRTDKGKQRMPSDQVIWEPYFDYIAFTEKTPDAVVEKHLEDNPKVDAFLLLRGDRTKIQSIEAAVQLEEDAIEQGIALDEIPAFGLTDSGKERLPSDRNLWEEYFYYYDLPGTSYLRMTQGQVDAGELPEKYREEWETYNKLKTDIAKTLYRKRHKEAAYSDWREDFRRANPEFDQWLIEQEYNKPLPRKVVRRPTRARVAAPVGVFSGAGAGVVRPRRGGRVFPKFRRPRISTGLRVRAPSVPGV